MSRQDLAAIVEVAKNLEFLKGLGANPSFQTVPGNLGTARSSHEMIQKMVDDMPSGGTLYFPAGTVRCDEQILIDKPMTIKGAARGSTYLQSWSEISTMFLVATQSAVVFEDMSFSARQGMEKTNGSFITIDPGPGRINYMSEFNRLTMTGGFKGIEFRRAADWGVTNSTFNNIKRHGISVANKVNGDSGDSRIIGCQFTGSKGAGVFQENSGGLIITGCKFNGLEWGYLMSFSMVGDESNLNDTSILLVSANSFENQSRCGISFTRSAPTGTFSFANIVGNEFALSPVGIEIEDPTSTFFNRSTIGNNIFALYNNSTGIVLNGGRMIAVMPNLFTQHGTTGMNGIYVAAAVVDAEIHPQSAWAINYKILNNSATTVVRN